MKKLLAANRGEIAIRIFRAATELGLTTVAVYTYEDRFALHRFKADESYLIGPEHGGEPVRGYLNIDQIVHVAREHGVDAVHPGYGFLAENAELARACGRAGIKFVGPTPELLETFGDKTAAKRLAVTAGVPTIPGTEHGLTSLSQIKSAAAKIGYPLIIKASFGGGGRGMRVVLTPDELIPKLEEAQREAGAAFGRTEVFIERYIRRAKHIEVQILGDEHGNLVHLWERDCSVQRRHQKVVEVAPSINVPQKLRREICEAAVALCRAAGYRNAGTVEFLFDVDAQQFYFIEVNPRVQVEHTVTEEVCAVDIVKSQILVAQGHRLHEAPLNVPPQDQIQTRGVAIQCRITTEDPENQFIPDYGRIATYRSPAGYGVRLDGASAFGGAVITPFFDSLLVKVTTRAGSLEENVRRMDRALREFRIRGVKTNIPFLENLINHPQFIAGDATTTFIDETPELFHFTPRRDRASRVLRYLGEVIVNGRPETRGKVDPKKVLDEPRIPASPDDRPPEGTRDLLLKLGPAKFAEWTRKQKRLLLTDTTMRDAHQSLLATRVRTFDMLQIAPYVAHALPNLFSLEMWGGATFDTSMRFLEEDPWQRLRELRQRVPNILFQMLLRGSNAVGYTAYPDNVVAEFVKVSAREGIDLFRVFDSLNVPEAMEAAVTAVREHTNSLCEAAICYTGDILDPRRTKYSLKYYVQLARRLEKMGTHFLAIKDMAGLCKPFAARALVKALRDEIGLPIHFHTHDTSGVNASSLLMASEAGVDVVDGAIASMSGGTSQPNLNSLVASLSHTPRDTQLSFDALSRVDEYWQSVREFYYPFEEGTKSPTAEVYQHEMPGGQYTNLKQQARSLGLADRWREIAEAYAAVNQLFGDIVKVTPSSKVVGDMALFMVTNGLNARDVLDPTKKLSFPRSVVEMMQGLIGVPEGGWPKVLQKIVLDSAGEKPLKGRAGAKLPKVNLKSAAKELARKLRVHEVSDTDVLSHLMYPQVFLDFHAARHKHGDVSVIPTPQFFYGLQRGEEVSVSIEPGKTLIVRYLATSEPREDGTRTIFFELNGQPREVNVADHALEGNLHKAPKADADNPHHVGASMPGKISTVAVKKGQQVKQGERLLSIEAMKMETAVYAPRNATIADVLVKAGSVVAAGDLLVTLQ
jgi:pyruvate carboxylase